MALEVVDLGDDRVLIEGEWRTQSDDPRWQVLTAFPRFGQICEFRDGRIFRVEYFPSPEEARAAELS